MKVREFMVRTPAYCNPESNLGAAAEILWNRNCGILPVVNQQRKVVGVMTDRDMCIALGTRNRLPGEISVREVMSTKVYTCLDEDDVHVALETMSKARVRRLPVLNAEGILMGILSMDDIVLHTEAASSIKPTDLTQKDVVNTLKRIYGPHLPHVAEVRAAAM